MNEQISRLMDGEIDAPEMDRVCATLRSEAGMATWSCYHTIGDALRGETAVTRNIVAALSRRLAQEATVLAPRSAKRVGTRSVGVGGCGFDRGDHRRRLDRVFDDRRGACRIRQGARSRNHARRAVATGRRFPPIICSRTRNTRRRTCCRVSDPICATWPPARRCVRRLPNDPLLNPPMQRAQRTSSSASPAG